ncbi:hypothetical protein ACDQ55_03830 [Chitinophaga sp. 30R24]|uniref:DUF922 domain-containing protein n=1 Tax=Chitinophaga sp. 30R24 TaxID=3248838 RepID=UPI003B90FBB5
MLSTVAIWYLLLLSHKHAPTRSNKTEKKHYTVIELHFEEKKEASSPESDTLFYLSNHQLQWNDFKAKPSPAGFSAAVSYTSFAYDGNSDLINDTLHITLQLQVFFIKSASWVRPDARDNYTLAHEQLHFDITRLVVERFKQKLRQTALNRDDYDSVIQYQYLKSFQEMNRLQYRFDQETNHGLNDAEQIRWRDKISVGLRNNGILPEELGIESTRILPGQ